MKKRLVSVAFLVLLAGHVHAFPGEVITSFFKLFKGGSVAAKEAATVATVGRSTAEGATAAKGAAVAAGMEHLPTTYNALRTSPLPPTTVEPKPNMVAEISGRSARDVAFYKALRDQAGKGDTKAMVEMSKMTSKGKINDPGEPFSGYWRFQAARAHDQAAKKMAQADCRNNEDLRRIDMWYDLECSHHDGISLYPGGMNTQFFPIRASTPFIPKQ